MNQVETEWKLVIQLDITALNARYEKMQEYLKNTEKRCGQVIAGNSQETCANMMQILDKENSQLTASLAQLRTLYNANTNKRGLINAIGTISKTLFGTMDAEDA
ncbi:hypothetical protein ALC57_15763, partial [Trachymyrmex cornetzi]